MKNTNIKIALLALIGFGSMSTLNSCRDAVDIIQDGEVNKERFFTSVANMNSYLLGDIYDRMDARHEIFISSLLTDEVKIGKDSGGQNLSVFRLLMTSTEVLSERIWLQNYGVISRVERLIDGASLVQPSSTEKARYNNILAQARAMRALSYFKLLTYYSEDLTDDAGKGVPVLTGIPGVATKLVRSTNAEVFAAIEEDLKFAEQHLTQSSRHYASKNMIAAMRARMYLYRGKHNLAKQYAQEVINNSGLSLSQAGNFTEAEVGTEDWNKKFYADNSNSPYRNIWTDTEQGEVIFAFLRPISGGSYGTISGYYNTNASFIKGAPLWVMGRNLFNLLDQTKGDIRRYAYVDPTSTIRPDYLTVKNVTLDQPIIDKYPGKGSSLLRNDVKMFRLSEMYLILAECAVAEGKLNEAANYVQKVREARNYLGKATTPMYTSTQVALADILKERRAELAFEGHRYIDLKRLASKAGVTADRNQTDDTANVTNLSNDSHMYTLPIPLSEFAGNPNMIQNKGY